MGFGHNVDVILSMAVEAGTLYMLRDKKIVGIIGNWLLNILRASR